VPGRTDRPLAALPSCPRFAIIQQAQQVNPIEWLEQVMVAARLPRQPAVLCACETAYANQQRMVHLGEPAQVLCQFKAIAAWHRQIKKHHLRRVSTGELQGPAGVIGDLRRVAHVAQDVTGRVRCVVVVVHDQDARRLFLIAAHGLDSRRSAKRPEAFTTAARHEQKQPDLALPAMSRERDG